MLDVCWLIRHGIKIAMLFSFPLIFSLVTIHEIYSVEHLRQCNSFYPIYHINFHYGSPYFLVRDLDNDINGELKNTALIIAVIS